MTDLIKRKAAAASAFNKIGKANGSAPPESTNNRFAIAYELFVADNLRSQANARYEAAKAAATDAGVINDDYAVGSHIPFKANGLSIVAKRSNDSSTLDRTMLKNHLMTKCKMDDKAASAVLEAGSKPRKGSTTHSFVVE